MTSLEKQTTPSRFQSFLHKKQTQAYMFLILMVLAWSCSKSIKNTPGAEHKSTKPIEKNEGKKEDTKNGKNTTTDLWDIDLSDEDDEKNDALPEEEKDDEEPKPNADKDKDDKEEASEPHFEHTTNRAEYRNLLGFLTSKLRGGNFTKDNGDSKEYIRNEEVGKVTISIHEEPLTDRRIKGTIKIWMNNPQAVEGMAVGKHVLRPTQDEPIIVEYIMYANKKRGDTSFSMNTAFENKKEFLNFLNVLYSKVTS